MNTQMTLRKFLLTAFVTTGAGILAPACGGAAEGEAQSSSAESAEHAVEPTANATEPKSKETPEFFRFCTPQAVACANHECGVVSNGCGGVWQCGPGCGEGVCIGAHGGTECACFTGYHDCPSSTGNGTTCQRSWCVGQQ